ncbi:MAG: putative porin [Bacteroidetes bacterium]|nr:putative porin [Bacteroidota bacterium]
MKKRFCFLLVLTVSSLSTKVLGQSFTRPITDTIIFNHHTGGDIDTLDRSFLLNTSMLPGTGFTNYTGIPNLSILSIYGNYQSYGFQPLLDQMQFSGLPHLGFFYSFGSKGVQTIHTDYQQKFGKSTLMNLVLDRNSSNGIIRNSNFTKSNFRLYLNKDAGRYKYSVQARYAQNKTNLSGGLSESPQEVSEYVFIAVNNENAFSESKIGQVLFTNKFSLAKDSSVIDHGFVSYHSFNILNRTFQEQNILGYQNPVNFDSISTSDQFQVNEISNGAGYYFSSKRFEIIGSFLQDYSQLQNLGWFTSRNNYSGKLKMKFQWQKFNFKNETSAVVFNQTNGLSSVHQYNPQKEQDLPLGYSKNTVQWGLNKFFIVGKFDLSNSQIALYQGFLKGNTYLYPNPQFNSDPYARTKRMDASMDFEYEVLSWLKIQSSTDYLRILNGVLWNGSFWGKWNPNYSIDIIQSKITVEARFKNFRIEPMVTLSNGLENLPEFQAGSRFSVTKRVFDAKKMKLLIAFEAFYTDSYQLMSYDVRVDNWQVAGVGNRSKQRYFMNTTFGFEIDEFRFFTKIENFQSLWNREVYEIAKDYFSSPFLVRLGITWDFFN